MKGFHLSTGASTATPLPDNINPMLKFSGGVLQPASEVTIDMTGVKKTQSRGFARIAKLVTSNNQTAIKKKELDQTEENCPKKSDLEQKRGYVYFIHIVIVLKGPIFGKYGGKCLKSVLNM